MMNDRLVVSDQTVSNAPMAWHAVALDLPRLHTALTKGDVGAAQRPIDELPSLQGAPVPDEDNATLREHVLDVLMVEGFVRRHVAPLGLDLHTRVLGEARRAADRLGMHPIISYPLYIRANSMAPDSMRCFTPYAGEARFIRMHRFIEDRFDLMIERLDSIADEPDPRSTFSEYLPDLGNTFRRVNRVLAGFRDPIRMPNHDFVDGFRPFYDSVLDPETGDVILDGPSGLQSPTFRIIAMLTGYEDPVLDGWTRRIAEYHDPGHREQLENALRARAAGRSLREHVDGLLPNGPALPHIHPDFVAHIPDLLRLARNGGYLSDNVESVFAEHGIEIGHWPGEAVSESTLPSEVDPIELNDDQVCALGPYVELEAMLFGFHVEHVAVAATHIGHERGTGGTSGVEFLMMALFRRAFPWLWVSGAGGQIVRRIAGG